MSLSAVTFLWRRSGRSTPQERHSHQKFDLRRSTWSEVRLRIHCCDKLPHTKRHSQEKMDGSKHLKICHTNESRSFCRTAAANSQAKLAPCRTKRQTFSTLSQLRKSISQANSHHENSEAVLQHCEFRKWRYSLGQMLRIFLKAEFRLIFVFSPLKITTAHYTLNQQLNEPDDKLDRCK